MYLHLHLAFLVQSSKKGSSLKHSGAYTGSLHLWSLTTSPLTKEAGKSKAQSAVLLASVIFISVGCGCVLQHSRIEIIIFIIAHRYRPVIPEPAPF